MSTNHTSSMEYSPIDYDVLRSTLNFTEVTPTHFPVLGEQGVEMSPENSPNPPLQLIYSRSTGEKHGYMDPVDPVQSGSSSSLGLLPSQGLGDSRQIRLVQGEPGLPVPMVARDPVSGGPLPQLAAHTHGSMSIDPGQLVSSSGSVPGQRVPPPPQDPRQGGPQTFVEYAQSHTHSGVPDPKYIEWVAQSSQLLTLPSCSPQKPLMITNEGGVWRNTLVPYPENVPDPVLRDQGPPSAMTENGDDDDNNCSHPQDPFQYCDQKMVTILHSLGNTQQYLQDIVGMVNNLRKACATNEESVVQKFDQFWNAVNDAFKLSTENFQGVATDMATHRETFNQLVHEYLPNNFGKLQGDIQKNWDITEKYLTHWEKLYSGIPQKLQEYHQYCQQLHESCKNLNEKVIQVQNSQNKEQGDVIDTTLVKEQFLEVAANMQEIFAQNRQFRSDFQYLKSAVKTFEEDHVSKRDLQTLANRISALEDRELEHLDFRASVTKQIADLGASFQHYSKTSQESLDHTRNLVRNLEIRLLAVEHIAINKNSERVSPSLVTPPTKIQPAGFDVSGSWAQTTKTMGIILGRVQLLDNMVVQMDKKVKDNEKVCHSAYKSTIPIQRIEKIEEDMRIVAEILKGLDEFENSLRDIRKRVDEFSGGGKNPPPSTSYLEQHIVHGKPAQPMEFSGGVQKNPPLPENNPMGLPPSCPPPLKSMVESFAHPFDASNSSNPFLPDKGKERLGEPRKIPNPVPIMSLEQQESHIVRGLSRTNFVQQNSGPPQQISQPMTYEVGNTFGNSEGAEKAQTPFADGANEENSYCEDDEVESFPDISRPQRGKHAEGFKFVQKDTRGAIEIAKRLKPRWDGNPLNWKDFWRRWEYFWEIRSAGMDLNPEIRKMIFIECLPREEADRAMQLVVMDGISFENLVKRYQDSCSSQMPRFVLEKRWRQCVPADRKWRSIDLWYSRWQALAANVSNLTPEQMREQFDAVMLQQYPKLVQRIHEEDLATGKIMSLDDRWNFIANKLQVSQVLTQIKTEYEQSGPKVSASSSMRSMQRAGSTSHGRGRSPGRSSDSRRSSSSGNCYNCGQPGHRKSDCPQKPRGRSPGRSPRKTERSGSRSSGRSNSSRGSYGKGRRNYSKGKGSSGRGRYPRRYSRSPQKPGYRPSSSGSRSGSNGRRNSSPYRGDRKNVSPGKNTRNNPSPHRGDRQKLLQRQKSGRCLECGSTSHRVADCPHRRSQRRPPTPRGASSRYYSRDQKNVNFKVSGIAGDPPTSGREGDVDHEAEEVVDAYLNSLPEKGDVYEEVYDNPYDEGSDAEYASETDFE